MNDTETGDCAKNLRANGQPQACCRPEALALRVMGRKVVAQE